MNSIPLSTRFANRTVQRASVAMNRNGRMVCSDFASPGVARSTIGRAFLQLVALASSAASFFSAGLILKERNRQLSLAAKKA